MRCAAGSERIGPRAALGLVLLAPLLLAGCASDEPAVALETLSLGTITGTVTDGSLKPLAGAEVRLDGANETTRTDEAGSFSLRATPGEYLVLASLDGYRGGALRASPGPGETARLAFVLAPIPTQTPEVVVAEQHGLLSCGATVVVAEEEHDAACGGSDPNARSRVAFPVDATDGLMGAVVEVEWDAHTELAGWFDVTVTTGEGDAATFLGASEGDGRVTISIPGRVLEGAVRAGSVLAVEVAPTGSMTDEEAGIDAGAVFQQPFVVYLSLFYHQVQPTGYTVVPSG